MFCITVIDRHSDQVCLMLSFEDNEGQHKGFSKSVLIITTQGDDAGLSQIDV